MMIFLTEQIRLRMWHFLLATAAVSSIPSQGESRSDSMTVGELQDEDDGNEQVCLMLLTAIKHDDDRQTRERIPFYIKHYDDGQTCERIPFYAPIDTGATRTFVLT